MSDAPASAPAATEPVSAPETSAPTADVSAAATPPDVETAFSGLGEDVESDLDTIEIATPATPAAPEASATQAPETPQVTEVRAAETQGAPRDVRPPQADAGKSEPPTSMRLQDMLRQLDTERDKLIAGLAAERFALTKEEAEAIGTEPERVIPALMAKTYYSAVTSALMHIRNMVPTLAQEAFMEMMAAKEAEDAFYKKYPGLDRQKHGADAARIAMAFRRANPKISRDELESMVAAAVAAKYNIDLRSAPRVESRPFRPASPGNGVRVVREPESPFEGLGRDYDE